MHNGHEKWMLRAMELAQKSRDSVSPNPQVGAIIVYKDRIIGEGRHEYFGGPHAEINALRSVQQKDLKHLTDSSIYVTLEPCDHQGKTGPCSLAIIESGIPRVYISNIDPFKKVNNRGIQRLLSNNIEVNTGILEQEGLILNRSFFTFHKHERPYVILKWAQSNDFFIGKEKEQIKISNSFSHMLSHKWRSSIDAILVGTNTVMTDDPQLTNRQFPGKSPVRLVLDLNNRIPSSRIVLNDEFKSIIYCYKKYPVNLKTNKEIVIIDENSPLLQQILVDLQKREIQSLLVEGGAKLLKTFIAEQIWDEARIITNTNLKLKNGIRSPRLKGSRMMTRILKRDKIDNILNPTSKLIYDTDHFSAFLID